MTYVRGLLHKLCLAAIVAVCSVAGIGAYAAVAQAHAQALPQGQRLEWRLVAHNEYRFVHRATAPYASSYSYWSTDLFELCTAGGTQCYAVEGTCHVSQDDNAANYYMGCRLLHNGGTVWSQGDPNTTGYVYHTYPFNLGSPQESIQSGNWQSQLKGYNADFWHRADANSDGSLCGLPCTNPAWGVTSSFNI